MDGAQIILLVMLVIGCSAGYWYGRCHPELRRDPFLLRIAPYIAIFGAIDAGYLGYTAHHRRAWWFLPLLIFLILAVWAFIRQRRISRAGH